ncbi:acetate--CoA ligase family protein [Roseovarius sp. EL26]|uniref:acetate--CoA ligase family protein n=1 Tax=Roseovarius sp. EL26 TaxID=2126672 RepID=UPI000EA21214|nr:acetate--CoA ligase family protein [Roseovarius sp. EL26]
MTPAKRQNFERLLNPRHIAFIGGSDAAIAIGEARRAGFAGKMWVVNPKREAMCGLPCVANLSDLPEAPDAVFLAIPAPAVPQAISDLNHLGAGGIVCYTAGFSEAHQAGRKLEEELKSALGDMVLVGPNCYGLVNYVGRSALWPFAHGGSCPGYGAAIITQSGMFSSDITMSQRSLPLAYMASAGNQADLGLTEFVDLMCERPEVRAIGLHIEGLSDIPAFERAALKALHVGTPIVALKTGSSVIGERLTVSHTGSLSGSNELYQALFDRVGVISVTNPAQFLETLKFLCIAGAPAGPDVMGFTCSGGGATMLADHGEVIGLNYPDPDGTTRQVLETLLPPIATVSNPLDYTTPIWGQADKTELVFAESFKHIPAQTALLVQDYPAKGLDESEQLYLNDGMAFARAAQQAGLPAAICATIPENMGAHIREALIAQGVAPMQGIHETLNAIRDAAWWAQSQRRILTCPPQPLLTAHSATCVAMISEAEAKEQLFMAGIPVPSGRVAKGEDVFEAAQEIGYPVALKMMSPALAHKTEAGAVALNIPDEATLRAEVSHMKTRVAGYAEQALSDVFLVEAMGAPPLAELVVGLRHDPQFGLAMTLGSGGILVELVGDTRSLLLPASEEELRIALQSLRVSTFLEGFRGKSRVNIEALIRALSALAEYAMQNAGDIAEIEINPLFVYDDSVLAVDCLMHLNRD